MFGLFETIMNSEDDPVPMFNWINRLVEHAGFHIDALIKAPYISEEIQERYLSQYKQALVAINDLKPQIEERAKQMQKQMEEQMAAQQQQAGGPDPKTQAAIADKRLLLVNNMKIKEMNAQFRQEEIAKTNDQRRKQSEETHQEKLRRSAEVAELKKSIEILKAQTA